MKKLSKEQYWWWVELLNILLMFHVVTLLVLLVLINISWKLVPSLIMLMLTPLEVWNTLSHQSLELLSKLRTHKIFLNLLMVLRNSQSLIHWLFVPLKNQVNTLLLDVVNSMLKFALTILKKILPTVKSLNQTPLSHSRKLSLLLQVLFVWPSHPTNTTESMLKLLHFTLILLILLKKVESQQKTILSQEQRS